jgi:hypothetical protein
VLGVEFPIDDSCKLILLKGKVKEKPQRENIYHEGAQRIHKGLDTVRKGVS